MNDTEVISDVRARFDEVHMDASLEAVLSRGRSLRRRRRLPGVAMAAAVACAIGVPVAGLVSGPGTRTTLDAWTVTRQPTGIVVVTIRQLNNPAGLQRTLRADGVRSFVRFHGWAPPYCASFPQTSRDDVLRKVLPDYDDKAATTAFAINGAAIPPGAAIWIQVVPQTTSSDGLSSFAMSGQLVYANGQCPSGSGGG